VTRPMALQESQRHGNGHDAHQILVRHHRQTLWIPWTLILLGAWLLAAPFSFGYGNAELWVDPSGGRGVWFAETETYTASRATLMIWSDVISGALLIVLGWRALRPDRPVSWWAACFVGIWLVFAPVLFWAPTAAAFLNSSVVGLLVIALTILIPGMPNMASFMHMGPPTPPGWSYNPSSWPQRSILIVLGFAGLVISRYLAAFQLGYIDWVWDPFFGFEGGTEPVLNSDLSHAWPISDAALGTVAYSFEFLMGFMGGPARWRTMPWMVTLFGILVIPLGLAHIALVMSQPVMVQHWSTLALAAAAVMVPMITLTVDEVVAMGQHVRQAARRGDRDGSWWKVFWLGGTAEGAQPDERTPDIGELPERPTAVIGSSLWGAGLPLNLVAVAALGVWLLFAPTVFGVEIGEAAAGVAHIGGALVLVVAAMALAEVIRVVRLANVAAALGIVVAVLFSGPPVPYAAAVIGTAVAVAVLSLPKGPVHDTYGTWNRVIR
jgi:hypothetical protein